jgi:hypothetical protein
MRRLLPASILFAVALAVVALAHAGSAGRAASTPGAVSGGAGGVSSLDTLPDLVVQSVVDNQNFNCTQPAGLKITVANLTTVAAGASTVLVQGGFAGTGSVSVPAIAANSTAVVYSGVWAPGSNSYTVTADSTGVIAESDESNNVSTTTVQTTSLPTCTWTPTATTGPATNTPTPTPTSTNTAVATATATAALPDLVVLSISDRQQGAAGCNTPAGLRIVVQNVKAGAAGASTLSVSAASGPSEDVGIPALAGNSAVTLFSGVTGIPFSDTYTAVADSGGAVVEADEANNTTAATIALATTATCTPSPTPGANTPTVTPTPTGFTTQDTDGDGLPGNADNCPFVYNPDQANSDRNLISNHPVYAVDDHTLINSDGIGDACDVDVDNDGLIDGDEASGLACPAASGPTNADSIDTDHDGFKDGYECGVGTDPANAASRPPPPSPGTDADNDHLSDADETSIGTDPNNADSDGDGLQDGWEVRGYASSPLSIDSDGDGTRDGCEAASLNADTVVNVGDQAMMAAEVMRPAPASQKLANFDLNKDGVLNPGDQAFQASRIGAGKCP